MKVLVLGSTGFIGRHMMAALEALLRPGSPYHDDFMPLYHSITDLTDANVEAQGTTAPTMPHAMPRPADHLVGRA